MLVLPTIGLGDTLMFTPALRELVRQRGAEVDVLVMTRGARDVLLGNPYPKRVLFYPLLERKLEGARFVLSLRGKYDVSINIFPSNKKEYNLVALAVGARLRLGHKYLRDDLRGLSFLSRFRVSQSGREHVVFENMKLVGLLGVEWEPEAVEREGLDYFITREERAWARSQLGKGLFLGVHPGSASRRNQWMRRWPPERFAALLAWFLDRFRGARVFLLGGPEEEALRERIREMVGKEGVYVVRETQIRRTAALLSQMSLFLGNDSALCHLAAALGVPTVGIYPMTHPAWTRPFGVPHRTVVSRLPCAPCYHYTPKPLTCPRGYGFACTREIPVSRVRRALLSLMQEVGLE